MPVPDSSALPDDVVRREQEDALAQGRCPYCGWYVNSYGRGMVCGSCLRRRVAQRFADVERERDEARELARAHQERADRLAEALGEARALALAVVDKGLDRLSAQANDLRVLANDALGDVPSSEEMEGMMARAALAGRRPSS